MIARAAVIGKASANVSTIATPSSCMIRPQQRIDRCGFGTPLSTTKGRLTSPSATLKLDGCTDASLRNHASSSNLAPGSTSGATRSVAPGGAALNSPSSTTTSRQERTSVGMIRGKGDPPGIVNLQEPLQANRPLERMHVITIVIRDRNHPAAVLLFDVDAQPLAPGEAGEVLADPSVRRHAGRFTEEDLPHVDCQSLVGVDVVGKRADHRPEVSLLIGRAAIAVELDVRHVHTMSVKSPHSLKGRLPVAGHPEIHPVQ